jgi:hypothetical protein
MGAPAAGAPIGVAEYLAVLPPEVRRIVREVRRLVKDAAPAATETVLWGGLSYHLAFLGGRVSGAVCQIGVRGGRVAVGFIHGVLLPDPQHLLRGSGKSKRSVDVGSVRIPDRRALAALVRSAVEIRPDAVISAREGAGGRPTRR